MTKKHILWGLFAAILAGLALAFFQSPKPSNNVPDLNEMLSDPKTGMKMYLYLANRDPVTGKSASGKTLGFEFYKEGGSTKYFIHNVFESGASEDIYLRADGSKEQANAYYPLKPGEEQPLMRSRAKFEADGTTFISHDVFNESGRYERSGRLLESGDYQHTYYCADGKRKERLRFFNAKKEFKSELVYDCASGKVYAEISPGNYAGQIKIKVLRPDGSKEADLTKDYSGIGGSVYDVDGETLIAVYRADYGSKSIKYYSDGSKDKLRLDISTTWGRTKAIVYNPVSGKRILTQEWKELPTADPEKKVEVLVKVTEFSSDKDNNWTREIEMSQDGKRALKLSYPLAKDVNLKTLVLPDLPGGMNALESLRNQMKIEHTLDENGLVVKTELSIEYQSWNNKVQPQPAKPLRFNLDQELFKMPPGIEIPVFNKEGPGRVYDYDGPTPPMSYSNPYSGYEWGGP